MTGGGGGGGCGAGGGGGFGRGGGAGGLGFPARFLFAGLPRTGCVDDLPEAGACSPLCGGATTLTNWADPARATCVAFTFRRTRDAIPRARTGTRSSTCARRNSSSESNGTSARSRAREGGTTSRLVLGTRGSTAARQR